MRSLGILNSKLANRADCNMREDIHSYYITSKNGSKILRLHLCSWLFKDGGEFLECGMEVALPKDEDSVELKVWIPWVTTSDLLQDLYPSLKDATNTKFIFNDNVESTHFPKDGESVGVVFDFGGRGKLAILPCKLTVVGDGYVLVKANLPKDRSKFGDSFYVRFLIKATSGLFSFRQQGISKSIYSYDLKVNEHRNCPDKLKPSVDQFCNVETVFCLHIIPSACSLAFLSPNTFKSVRILEKGAYEKYANPMKGLPKIEDKDLMVVFNKDRARSSYSFFSVFEKESIGNAQVIMAISLNILVSSFFFLLPIVARAHPFYEITWKVCAYVPLGLIALAIGIWMILRDQVNWKRYSVCALATILTFIFALVVVSR